MIGLRRAAAALARGVLNVRPLRAAAASALERIRARSLMAEDFLPFEVYTFDARRWVIKETDLGFRIWVSLEDRAVSRPILLDAYERDEAQFLMATVRPGDVVVDAGANVGFHALLLAKLVGPAGRVYAFEPLPYLADALERSIAENGFESRLELHRLALDETAGPALLRHAPRTANFGGAHLAPDGAPEAWQADVPIERVRLDDVIGDARCSLIKMDVEGAEPRVVRGATKLLTRDRAVVLAELHDAQMRRVSGIGPSEFLAQMRALGFRAYGLCAGGGLGREIVSFAGARPVNVVFSASH